MKAAVNYPDEASPAAPSRSFARYLPAIARILMGVPLLVFGLNGFFNFIPPPKTPLPEGAMAFATALAKSGYMMQLIAVTQLVVGALLVVNRFVPLAILLLAPFLVNSLAFHLFLERSGLGMAVVFAALEVYLAWVYRRAYAPLFVARTGPA
jgi:uncharacterized membrane protein YphA (DoxX/SURF4 family)